MSVLVLVVDDEPDVEALFRQQFRRDLRAQRFVMDFAIAVGGNHDNGNVRPQCFNFGQHFKAGHARHDRP